VNLRTIGSAAGVLLLGVCGTASALRSATRPAGLIVTTGQMIAACFDPAAVLLPTGRVLIVGGIERNGVMQPGAELFYPVTGRFALTGSPLAHHGWGVTSTLLPNGKILVAGGSTGCDSPCFTASAELYDSASGTFALTGNMTVPRAEARAVLLRTGEVLLVGGAPITKGTPFLSAELYQPSTGKFTSLGFTHLSDATQITLLSDGEVLVVGSSGTDLYSPSSRQFTSTGAMTVLRNKFGGALLPDGRVLIAGGQTGGAWECALQARRFMILERGDFSPDRT
jgi:hypothetical protein